MGFRYRKSIKIAPGVKMNISKNGIGFSAGVKGARVSVNSKGRVTKTVSIPGTGISYSETSKLDNTKAPKPKKRAKSFYELPEKQQKILVPVFLILGILLALFGILLIIGEIYILGIICVIASIFSFGTSKLYKKILKTK